MNRLTQGFLIGVGAASLIPAAFLLGEKHETTGLTDADRAGTQECLDSYVEFSSACAGETDSYKVTFEYVGEDRDSTTLTFARKDGSVASEVTLSFGDTHEFDGVVCARNELVRGHGPFKGNVLAGHTETICLEDPANAEFYGRS